MTTLQQQLKSSFPDLPLEFEYDMAKRTYFKVGGPAEVYVELANLDQIIKLVTYCRDNDIKLTIFGGGSNVIVADEGIKGVILRLTNDEVETEPSEKGMLVRVGAGMKTALAVRKTVDLGLKGLEYFLGVPGSLGGAIYNNAHYLEDLIGEHVSRVQVLDELGEVKWLEQSECEFGYDVSRFQRTQEIILQVELDLATGDKQESTDLIRKATIYRANTQPLGMPSSGCIFQNTPNTPELKERFPQFADRQHVSGGFLIDQAGLKGTKIGDIEVSEKHAAFFVNNGEGKAKDIKELINKVKATVKKKFGVELQEEVFWLGYAK